MKPQPQPSVVYVQQPKRGASGCLVFLLFGWLGLATLGAWRLTKWTLRASLAPLRWTWQACVASARWTARGARWLTTRYGWRGWAVVGGVIVALAILGALTSHH